MKVRAVAKGYFNESIRLPGAEFDCTVEQFSDALRKTNPPGWMEIVSASPEEQKAVDELRRMKGVRQNKPAPPKGSAPDLGVGKAIPVEVPGFQAKPEEKPEEKKGGTGSKDVLSPKK